MDNYRYIVEKVCKEAGPLLNSDDAKVRIEAAAKVTRVVAWEIYSKHDKNCGLIRKTGGSQIQNLSVDKILFKDSKEYVDILGGAGDKNGSKPAWQVEKDTRNLTWVKPVEEYYVTPDPPPDPPAPEPEDEVVDLLSQILQTDIKILAELIKINQKVDNAS